MAFLAAAHHRHHKAHAKPVTFDSAPPTYCGKGKVLILHTNWKGPTHWGCVKGS